MTGGFEGDNSNRVLSIQRSKMPTYWQSVDQGSILTPAVLLLLLVACIGFVVVAEKNREKGLPRLEGSWSSEDGAIEFLGRQDNQSKIRGQRIELAEIDAALKSHPAISQAVSIVSDSEGRNDPQIIAYITLKPGQNESPIMSQPEKVMKVFLKD